MMGKRHAEAQAEQQQQWQQPPPQDPQYQQPPPQEPQYQQPPPQQSRGISTDDTARLQELGKLHEQGILTDEEFAQQKAVILGTG